MTAPRTYLGHGIDRAPGSGYWRALTCQGWVKADTLAGLKGMIRAAVASEKGRRP